MPRKARGMSISFTRFCEQLGCPLLNPAWSWSAIAPDNSRSIFTLWVDQIENGRYVFMSREQSESWTKRNGANELVRNFQTSMQQRSEVLGVLCFAEDESADPRKRKGFDQETLLVLELAEENDAYVAYIKGQVTTSDAIRGPIRSVAVPIQYASDDLDDRPPGVETPERTHTQLNGYLRDSKVRNYVLKRAGGICEYCGKIGFLTRGGTRYLETHHVIALSDSGPDTVANVIGLCSEHHREAHYGEAAWQLEEKFVEILSRLEPR